MPDPLPDPSTPRPAAEPPVPADPTATWVVAAVLAVLAIAGLLRGWPWPNVDDVSFAGAGIDLARTGQLTDSYISAFLHAMGTDKFYIQPPVQPYTLAGWLKVFGVSTASLRAFQWVWYLAGGVGIVRLVRRCGLPTAAGLLLVGIYFLNLSSLGLRPEAEAFALLFLGLSLMDGTAGFPQKLGALVLLGLAPLTYPLSVGIAVPFACLLIAQTQPVGTGPARQRLAAIVRSWGPALAVAGTVVTVGFLAMIRFDLAGFLAAYGAHMRYRAGYVANDGGKFHYFLRTQTENSEAVLTLPFVLGLVAAGLVVWRRRQLPAMTRGLVLACLAAAVCCECLYVVSATPWTVWLASCALAALAMAARTRLRRRVGLAALAGLALMHFFLAVLDLCLRQFPDPSVLQAARQAAGESSKELMVDGSTMRYVFDFRPPRPAHDDSLLTRLPPGQDPYIWVVAPGPNRIRLGLPEPTQEQVPRITLGHHVFKSRPLCPDQPLVLP